MDIKISETRKITGDEQRMLYSYAVELIKGINSNPGINIVIIKDIFNYFKSCYSGHEPELMRLSPEGQNELLNKLFGDKDIVELTGNIMNRSAISNGVDPNKMFGEQDEKIIKDIYGFRNSL